MKLVFFTSYGDGSAVAINPQKVAQVAIAGSWTRLTLDHGREVDVSEGFDVVCRKLQEAT